MYKSEMTKISRGFTLVELLIVIAILAVLSTATVVVLNPAELLAQARDSQRISDFESLNSTLAIYLSQTPTITLCTSRVSPYTPVAGDGCHIDGRCSASAASAVIMFAGGAVCPALGTPANARLLNATGWVDVNLGALPGGSPIPSLPIDPTNSAVFLYGYKAVGNCVTATTYVLRNRLESVKNRGKMTTDGDDRITCTTYLEDTCWYSVGTDPGLNGA